MSAKGSEHYLNRELSWLEFNQRVLDEAMDANNPLLERVKFLCIVSSNLDEFFEVRVAGIKQQADGGGRDRSPDGLTPKEVFQAISRRVRDLVDDQYRCWRDQLVPALARERIGLLRVEELEDSDRQWIGEFYRAEVGPTLTPLGLDTTHPFPQLLNKSLNLMVRVDAEGPGGRRRRLAVVQVPRILPRLVKLPRADGRQDYVFLGRLIGHFLADLFPGTPILGFWAFRVTRNSELYIDEEAVANLLKAVEIEVQNRRRGEAVRLEVEMGMPDDIREELLKTLRLTDEDAYLVDGPLNPTGLLALCAGEHSPELRDPPFHPPVAARFCEQEDVFAAIHQGDVLLHHPYESFDSVIHFLQQAALDPNVLAIKQTLYRTGGDTRVVGALMEAVKKGKQVTAVVELRARFDEANNIEWSRQLEEAGVHVVYGLVGYKIHAKITLVVRRDTDGIRRYVHLGTGNYNPTTSRIYTDLGLLTCDPDFGEDATNLFNLLTGICQYRPSRKLVVAPFELHDRMVALIAREADHARRGLPSGIIAKMNSLVDTQVIDGLYAASQAGVKIELIVRGVCCLRPGVPGLSENITVRSIVSRFLEHSRIFCFENACRPEVFLSSADWMPRNFFRRIETVFPIQDGRIRDRILREILGVTLQDNIKARWLRADGTYARTTPSPSERPCASQEVFMALARSAAEGARREALSSKAPGRRMRLRARPAQLKG
ncbi:MAG: polyphosphate kinase 1 [Limisphaerales bacterium]